MNFGRPSRQVLLSSALAAMVLFVYGRVGSYPFILLDDETFLVRNPAATGGLTSEGVRWAFSTVMDAGWIPVTWISRLLDITLFGLDAGKHHLVNVLFHLGNTLLLFHFLRKSTGRIWEGAFVAGLFAVHPLHVESVAWVTERKDVLAGFFWMLSCIAYVRYAERPGIGRYGTVAAFFVMGLMSKPIVVTLPFVLILLDYWPLCRFRPCRDTSFAGHPASPSAPFGRLLLEKIPLLLVSAGFSAATYFSQKSIGAVTPLTANPFWSRAGNALFSYAVYLRKAAWPVDLAVFYPHPGPGLAAWKPVAAGLALCAATGWVVRRSRTRRWLATGWFWYLGTLVPVLGLVQVGGNAMADRNVYLPLIGIYLVVARCAGELVSRCRVPGVATACAASVPLLLLAYCASGQVEYWRGSEPLFRRALQVTEENWLAHALIGQIDAMAGRDADAERHYREALRIWPELPEVHNSLGEVLDRMGRSQEALANFREELRIAPMYSPAHYNIGVIYYRAGRIDDAAEWFRETLRIQPDHADAHNNLGVYLLGIGRVEEAAVHFREALRVRPAFADAHRNLGVAFSRAGSIAEAIGHLQEAVRLQPDNADARNNLGVLYARSGRYGEAMAEFREVLRRKPDHADARYNFGRAAAEWENAERGRVRSGVGVR